MPDWSYRTLFRPLLFALPARLGRDVALTTIGALARSPLGPHVIDFMGHMRPPVELARRVLGRRLSAPIGIGAQLDPSGFALAGLARFGVGFVEIGPVMTESPARASVRRDAARQAIIVDETYTAINIDTALARLRALPPGMPVIVRMTWTNDERGEAVWKQLNAADGLEIAAIALEAKHLRPETVPVGRPWLLTLSADAPLDLTVKLLQIARASNTSCAGVLIVGVVNTDQECVLGAPAREPALALVRALRAQWPSDLAIVAGGGVHEPQHALDLFAAGADLVSVDSGLVYSGPGLVKRINEALLAEAARAAAVTEESQSPARYAWYWLWLMGLAMFFGGGLALAIAGTRVVLPYDEHFVGMTRAELQAINPRLLSFMTHDRVTLAGTMLSIGILYSGLAWHGMRRGYHWAWVAVLSSAMTGFLSFFSFLGYGYFEPFHAFVTAVLFQLLLMGWHAPLPPRQDLRRVPLVEEWRWRLAQWGQLLLIVEALAVLTAGLVICIVGSTSVFVAEDLAYMGTCSAALEAANPRLIALVAHDRATFGGMLVASGLTTLMATLWGFAAGRAWLWTTLMYAGTVGYVCTLIVHYAVGYIDFHHLLPAYGGLALHWLALGLAAPYLRWQEYQET